MSFKTYNIDQKTLYLPFTNFGYLFTPDMPKPLSQLKPIVQLCFSPDPHIYPGPFNLSLYNQSRRNVQNV